MFQKLPPEGRLIHENCLINMMTSTLMLFHGHKEYKTKKKRHKILKKIPSSKVSRTSTLVGLLAYELSMNYFYLIIRHSQQLLKQLCSTTLLGLSNMLPQCTLPAKFADSVDLKDGLLNNRVYTVQFLVVESYFSCYITQIVEGCTRPYSRMDLEVW